IWAQNEAEAWKALGPWRGLRAPGRLEAVDPKTLRERADEMPRSEILGRYSVCSNPAEALEVYGPLVEDLKADVVCVQMTCPDQPLLISILGDEVLPLLRALSPSG